MGFLMGKFTLFDLTLAFSSDSPLPALQLNAELSFFPSEPFQSQHKPREGVVPQAAQILGAVTALSLLSLTQYRSYTTGHCCCLNSFH